MSSVSVHTTLFVTVILWTYNGDPCTVFIASSLAFIILIAWISDASVSDLDHMHDHFYTARLDSIKARREFNFRNRF